MIAEGPFSTGRGVVDGLDGGQGIARVGAERGRWREAKARQGSLVLDGLCFVVAWFDLIEGFHLWDDVGSTSVAMIVGVGCWLG